MRAGGAWVLLGVLCATAAGGAERVDVLVRHANVVDVVAGQVLPDQDIAVRAGHIVAIRPAAVHARWQADTVVDGAGKFAIPGLWDMHVHFGGGDARGADAELIEENRNLLPLYVAHGITSVRDAAGDIAARVFQWRAEVAAGELLGPTIYTSGPKIEGPGTMWHGTQEVGTREQMLAALDRLQQWQADFVKLTDDKLAPDLFLQAVAEAHARGLKTSAHVPLAVTIDEASAAGLSSIEHLDYAYKAGSTQESAIAQQVRAGSLTRAQAWAQLADTFDPATAQAAYARLAARGTAVTPTLHISHVIAYLDEDTHARDDYLKYIGPELEATYAWRVQRAARDDAAAVNRRHAHYERMAATLPMLQQAGVLLLAGTDSGYLNSYNYPGIALHEELALFVGAGLTALQALRAATINGAQFLGHAATTGSLAAGKTADLVLLNANPLQGIRATRQIDTVILRVACSGAPRWMRCSRMWPDAWPRSARHCRSTEATHRHGPVGRGGQKMSRPVSRVLSRAIIPLGSASPRTSSGLPGSARGSTLPCTREGQGYFPIWPCSRWGLPCRRVLPPTRCALTAPFHPYRSR